MKLKCKDFEIKGYFAGNRIANKPQYAYKVIYNAADGRTKEMNEKFYTKEAAQKYISKTVRTANIILERNKHYECKV